MLIEVYQKAVADGLADKLSPDDVYYIFPQYSADYLPNTDPLERYRF